jgi:hypothetical protein
VVPADRFTPTPPAERELLPLWLPLSLAPVTRPDAWDERSSGAQDLSAPATPWPGGPVEFDRVVPPSGNLQVAGKQFWLGPARAGNGGHETA